MKYAIILTCFIVNVCVSQNPLNNTFIVYDKDLDTVINTKYLETYKERLIDINSKNTIKISQNYVVPIFIDKYLSYKWLPKTMGLANYYFYLFKLKLKKYNLPEELKYLAVIESNLNPQAISKVGAKGLWQFMPGTGKQYGLYENKNVSLFYDPIASTDAACQYLAYLYNKFHDWELTLAAYNAGEGRIERLMKRTGYNDYWSIRPYLPKETQYYVPSFLAVQYIMNYYEYHNIKTKNFLLDFKNIKINKAEKNITIFKLYSNTKGKEVFHFINPHIKSHTIFKGTYYYTYN